MTTNLARQYTANSIKSASPEKIVIMMFDGAIRFLRQAQQQMHGQDVAGASESLSRAQAIIAELNSSLDHTHNAQVTENLTNLYTYCLDTIIQVNVNRRPNDLGPVVRVLENLRAGFDGAINQLTQ